MSMAVSANMGAESAQNVHATARWTTDTPPNALKSSNEPIAATARKSASKSSAPQPSGINHFAAHSAATASI